MHPTHEPPSKAAEVYLTPADVLRGAALYIARHGFHQDDMFANLTQFAPPACAMGAIRMAACGSATVPYTIGQASLVDATITHLAEYILTSGNRWYSSGPDFTVADWNDEPARTAEHVIATLRAAAERWDLIFGGAE